MDMEDMGPEVQVRCSISPNVFLILRCLMSGVAGIQIGLLNAPVCWDLLGPVPPHVLLHSRQTGAKLQADGAAVGRRPIVCPQVFDHRRVVPRPLMAKVTFKGFLSFLITDSEYNQYSHKCSKYIDAALFQYMHVEKYVSNAKACHSK